MGRNGLIGEVGKEMYKVDSRVRMNVYQRTSIKEHMKRAASDRKMRVHGDTTGKDAISRVA